MSVNPVNNDLAILPDELVVDVLRELPAVDLQACSLVSKRLNRLFTVAWKDLIKEQCGAQCFGILSQLVDQGWMTWGEAYRHREALSTLLSTWMRDELSTNDRILEKNPQLVAILADAYTPDMVQQRLAVRGSPEIQARHLILHPVVVHRDVIFSVMNLSDIEIEDEKGKRVLEGEPGKLITCLAHDGRYLYALREDGWVVRWNPETGTHTKIPTSLSKNPQMAEQRRRESLNANHYNAETKDFFLCKEGFIVIRGFQSAEVITESGDRIFISDSAVSTLPRYFIQDKRLYAAGNITAVWNLETGVRMHGITMNYSTVLGQDSLDSLSSCWMTKDSLFIYEIQVVTTEEMRQFGISGIRLNPIPHKTSLLKFSLLDGRKIYSLKVDPDFTGCAVVGNFLLRRPGFIFQKTARQKVHVIFDMRTGKAIGNIDLVLNPVSRRLEIRSSIQKPDLYLD